MTLVAPLLGDATLPWWVCPPDRELMLRSKIKTGYSTIASRANLNKYSPITGMKVRGLSVDELITIEDVVKKATAIERMHEMRISSLLSEHEKLKKRCEGDGVRSCVLCGYDFSLAHNLEKSTHCYLCAKVVCTDCRSQDLMSKTRVFLCPVCSSEKELWCKTGAWADSALPQQKHTDEELEEWLNKMPGNKQHKTSLDMTNVQLGSLVRHETQESIGGSEIAEEDWSILRESRPSLKFRDTANEEQAGPRNSHTTFSLLEDLREEENVGIDDLLLAQQLRSESPITHQRMPSGQDDSPQQTPPPSSSPRLSRSRAMSQEQRQDLSKVRSNVVSRTPSPWGGTGSMATETKGTSSDFTGLAARHSMSPESDSSLEVNKELHRIQQMTTTEDSCSDAPAILISSSSRSFLHSLDDRSTYDDQSTHDEDRSSPVPMLKRKNASRRKARSPRESPKSSQLTQAMKNPTTDDDASGKTPEPKPIEKDESDCEPDVIKQPLPDFFDESDLNFPLKQPVLDEPMFAKETLSDEEFSIKPPLVDLSFSVQPPVPDEEVSIKQPVPDEELFFKQPVPTDEEASFKQTVPDEEASFKQPVPDEEVSIKQSASDESELIFPVKQPTPDFHDESDLKFPLKQPHPDESISVKRPLPDEEDSIQQPIPDESDLSFLQPVRDEPFSLKDEPLIVTKSNSSSPVKQSLITDEQPSTIEQDNREVSPTKEPSPQPVTVEDSPKKPSPRRRTLQVKASPSPSPSHQQKEEATQDTATTNSDKPSHTFKRRNATRSGSKSTRSDTSNAGGSEEKDTESTSGMSTLERKKAKEKAKLAARRFKQDKGRVSPRLRAGVEKDEEEQFPAVTYTPGSSSALI